MDQYIVVWSWDDGEKGDSHWDVFTSLLEAETYIGKIPNFLERGKIVSWSYTLFKGKVLKEG